MTSIFSVVSLRMTYIIIGPENLNYRDKYHLNVEIKFIKKPRKNKIPCHGFSQALFRLSNLFSVIVSFRMSFAASRHFHIIRI